MNVSTHVVDACTHAAAEPLRPVQAARCRWIIIMQRVWFAKGGRSFVAGWRPLNQIRSAFLYIVLQYNISGHTAGGLSSVMLNS